jgi:hypothetical protein
VPAGFVSFARSYTITTGSLTDAGKVTFEGGNDPVSKTSIMHFQDTVLDEARIQDGKLEQTMTIKLATEMWSSKRALLDETYIVLQSFTVAMRVDGYDESCSEM